MEARPEKRKREDLKKIDLHDPSEVEYWCQQLGCTREKLIVAVLLSGPSVEKVRSFLEETPG